MTTKDRIVQSAIKLFNSKGIGEVTLRDIGNDVGISSGNVAYHFQNKEAIIEYFYGIMYDEVTINTDLKNQDGFEQFQKILEGITTFMTKYRFFYRDIIEIFRICPSIKKDYAGKYQQRKQIYIGILRHFSERSLLKPGIELQIFGDVAHTIWFTLTFWQAQKKILSEGLQEVQPDFVISQIWGLLIPYMTKKGLAEYATMKDPSTIMLK